MRPLHRAGVRATAIFSATPVRWAVPVQTLSVQVRATARARISIRMSTPAPTPHLPAPRLRPVRPIPAQLTPAMTHVVMAIQAQRVVRLRARSQIPVEWKRPARGLEIHAQRRHRRKWINAQTMTVFSAARPCAQVHLRLHLRRLHRQKATQCQLAT